MRGNAEGARRAKGRMPGVKRRPPRNAPFAHPWTADAPTHARVRRGHVLASAANWSASCGPFGLIRRPLAHPEASETTLEDSRARTASSITITLDPGARRLHSHHN